jgi:hypothetical protein
MPLHTTALAGCGIVALAFSAPATNPTAAWENTQTQNYHCAGKDVVRCETTAGGTCFAIEFCEAYCFNHKNGALCVDMGASSDVITAVNNVETTIPRTPVSVLAARDASSREDKHYTCSRNRASVLICRYGFCSTDYYCGSSDECKDDCLCCKTKSSVAQGAKSAVRTVPIQIEGATIDIVARESNPQKNKQYICSKDRTSVLKCTYGFCSTDHYCAKRHPCVDNPARCTKAHSALD